MTDQDHWWARTAKALSRNGLLWLALTAIALSSLISSGAGMTPNARLIAASNVGSTSKLKTNGPGAPTAVPGELSQTVLHRAHGPEATARRILEGTPGAVLTVFTTIAAMDTDRIALGRDGELPVSGPSPFAARAPPAIG